MPDPAIAPDDDRTDAVARRRLLSLLADGEADDAEAARGLDGWRDDAQARQTWHAYQLIGDVLRSDDLARPAARDAAFLAAVRERLAQEPVVLAPVTLPQDAPGGDRPARHLGASWVRAHWQAPAAMAAGFLLVVGGLAVFQRPSTAPGMVLASDVGASAPAAPRELVARTANDPLAPAPAKPAARSTDASRWTADARLASEKERAALQPYLAAHRQITLNAAFQMPDAGMRVVNFVQTAPAEAGSPAR